jgi:hypothetical protein
MSSLTPIAIHAVAHPDLGFALPPIAAPGVPPLAQTRLWRDTLELLGGEVQSLAPAGLKGFATVSRLPGAGALLGPVVRVARGARGLTEATARDLRRTLERRHIVMHATGPEQAGILAAVGFRQIAPARKIAGIGIDRRPKDLLRGMAPDWRQTLRAASGQELAVRRIALPPDPAHWAFERWDPERATAPCRTDDTALTPRVVAAMAAADPGAVQVFAVTRAGRRLAVMLVLRHGAGATCPLLWTHTAGSGLGAGHLCLWRAMLELRQLGVQWLDLGPADWHGDPEAAGFLSGAGASLRAHGGAWLRRRRPRPAKAPFGGLARPGVPDPFAIRPPAAACPETAADALCPGTAAEALSPGTAPGHAIRPQR